MGREAGPSAIKNVTGGRDVGPVPLPNASGPASRLALVRGPSAIALQSLLARATRCA
ncbi:MAG: hypothetical protein H0W74_04275 [Sphingosinicella sp.]|nr:hypothetical protein [Sphingosinicella sp.]